MSGRTEHCYRHPEEVLPARKGCPVCWREMKATGLSYGKAPARIYDTVAEALDAVKRRPYSSLVVGVSGVKMRVFKDGRAEVVPLSPASRPPGRPPDPVLPRLLLNREVSPSGCWLWTGIVRRDGYARICRNGRGMPVHRAAYLELRGSIPDGLDLDHLCRVRHCFNPDHLEPVTPQVNSLRGETVAARNASKTHCLRGHEFTPENTYRSVGGRCCRSCQREVYSKRKYGKKGGRP